MNVVHGVQNGSVAFITAAVKIYTYDECDVCVEMYVEINFLCFFFK